MTELLIIIILAITAIAVSSAMLAKSLRVKKFVIPTGNKQLKGKTVIAFSDLHMSSITTTSQLKRCVDRINSFRPDYVFFLGDVVQRKKPSYSQKSAKKIKWLLGRVNADCGKYAVWGNHDKNPDGGINRYAAEFISENGYKILENSGEHLVDGVYLAGVDESLYGTPDIEKALADKKEGDYVILLSHEPDFADVAAENGVELQLSGHSHGGQIYIPLTGSLFQTRGAKKYYRDTHKIKNTDLLISYGVGSHTLPFRFLAPPDIILIEYK